MASDQQFCLRWNNHQSTLVSVFDNLLESQTLVDCTLAADGQYLKAHKVVLSACSPYLEAILCQNLDKHPILILKDVKFSELKAMLDYMYRGEVNISQEQLSTFLKAAESLQIKGLTDSGGGGSSDRDRETLKRQDLRKPLNQPVPILSQPRPVVPHAGGLMERRSLPHFPPHIADMQPQSPRHAREGSTSPTARKRRRPNRPSSDDSNFVSTTPNSLSENQPDTSDSCDVPVKQAASTTPNVPNAATKAPETDSNRTTPQPQNNQQNSEQKQQVTVKKEFSEALLTPKTEFDYGNDNSMEDVTYEDDEEEEVDLSKPGTSFAANSQGFPPWQMGGDGSNDDSNNMYSPDVTAATNQNNSQGRSTSVCIKERGTQHGAAFKKEVFRGRFTSMEKKEVKKKTKKNQGLKKQIVRLADELSKIASVTRESLLSSDSDVEIVSDSEVECVVVDDDSDCEAHNTAGDLEFQAVQDNGPVVELMEHGPSVDPLSIDCVIKTEPVVIKSEDSIYVTIGTTKPAPLPAVENEILPSEAKDKCVHTYSCDLCSYTSNYSTVMGVHKWRVHNIKGNSKLLYKCNLCNSSFRKAKSLRSHMKRPCSLKKSLDHKIEPSQTKEGDVNMFSCNLCSFTCEHSTVLGQHKWRVHKIKKISNPDLLNQSKNNILPSQTKKGNVGRFRCNLCSYTSNHKTVLGQHKWRVHEKNNIPISNLDCLKQPKSEILPSQTKKGGVGKFRCDLCPYTSNHKTVLGQHKWREHKINRISHPDLLKLSKSDILPPQIKKEDVGRFRCDLCSFTSNHNAVIGTHKRRVHNIKGNSKLNCNLCFFTTTNPKTLSYHKFHRHNVRVKKSHGVDLERSYNVRSSALKNETDVGDQNLEEKKGPEPIQKTQCSQKLGVPVFKRCQLCPFKTKVYEDLVLHKKKVHTVKLQPKISAGRRGHFKCTACHKSFTYQHNLLRHSNTSCRGLETSDITSRTIKHETSSGESELITEEKISCSFCGKQMKFQFQLRRHLEREHPDGWEKLKMETPLSNEEEQMQDVNKTDNRHEINESVTDNYYECNLCPFQTKSFRVIKIHRQLSHRKKKKADSHGSHVVKCWLCSEKLTFRSQLMRHYKTYHHNDWLEFVRSSQQSNIQLKGIERNGLDLENTPESSKDSSNISLKIGSTSRNSIESDKSWTDINPGELEQSVPARKFCQRCDRSYNSSYFIYHTCKKIIKCCFCNFVTRSSYMMHNHKTKLHRTQKVAKEGVESSEGTECKESQNPDVSRTSITGVTLKKKINKRMASAGHSTEVANADQRTELASEDKKSVLEVSVEKELTCKALALKKRKPSKASRKKTSMITPRKTCSLCHKSYHAVYFRYHRCSKINKGNKIECALCKLHFQENSFQDHPCRPILKCKICPFTTRFKMTMRSHITNHVMDDSDLTEESLYKCKTCQKEFVSVSWFILHKRKGCQSTQMSVDHSQGIERVEEATCSSASRVSDFDDGADRS